MKDFSYTGWQKSSYSNSSANCVEVSFAAPPGASGAPTRARAEMVGVRDSKQHGGGPVLEFSVAAWSTFLTRAKTIELAG
jgi:hypothetical protein